MSKVMKRNMLTISVYRRGNAVPFVYCYGNYACFRNYGFRPALCCFLDHSSTNRIAHSAGLLFSNNFVTAAC